MKVLVFGATGGTGRELVTHTGTYQHGFAVTTTYKDIAGWISRSDVADFMLKQLTDDAYVHCTPGVSY